MEPGVNFVGIAHQNHPTVKNCSLFLSLLLAGSLSAQLPGEWLPRQDMPTARKEIANAAVALDGKIYVVGGRTTSNQPSAAFEVYDPATDQWQQLPDYPLPVWRATAAAMDGKIFVFGGFRQIAPFPFDPTDQVFAFDPQTNTWSPRAAMPVARGAAAAVPLAGKIYVVGGANSAALKALHIYDPATDSWETGPPMASARSGLTANVLDGEIYAVGGYFLSGGVVSQSSVERFDPQSQSWSPAPELPITKLGIASAVAGGRLFVFGGETDGAVPTKTLSLEPGAGAWAMWATTPEPVNFAGAAAVNDTLYLMGGGEVNLSPDAINKTFCFLPETVSATEDPPEDALNWSAFPNPTRETLHVALELPRTETVRLRLLDLQGQAVWEGGRRTLPAGPQTLHLPPPGSGLFLLELQLGSQHFVKKIIGR